MEKRKSIEIEQKMRETKKETKFYFKKSINHEYEEE